MIIKSGAAATITSSLLVPVGPLGSKGMISIESGSNVTMKNVDIGIGGSLTFVLNPTSLKQINKGYTIITDQLTIYDGICTCFYATRNKQIQTHACRSLICMIIHSFIHSFIITRSIKQPLTVTLTLTLHWYLVIDWLIRRCNQR
jgi:hypothetical protein